MYRPIEIVFLSALIGCGGAGAGGGGDDDDAPVDAAVDAGPMWIFDDVYGVPNLDDDNSDGMTDWTRRATGDDDFAKLVLPARTLSLVGATGDVELVVTGDVADVRIFRGTQQILGTTSGATATFVPDGSDVELTVELRTYATTATLAISARASGVAAETAQIKLRAAPLIMNHHLQPAEHVWAVSTQGNAAMIASFQTALGASFTAVSGNTYGSDVWIQDEFEFALLTGAENQRLDVVIDSNRNRGIDDFAEDDLVGPDVIAQTWGTSQATTYDSFGNLEASPPVTVNGVSYPFGRIYYGYNANVGINSQLRTFLGSQKVQKPIEIMTSWLCVGHVDEFISFVPDPSSAKGFKMVIADVPSAYAMIDAMASTASLGRYGNDHGYTTVGTLRSDADLRAYNVDLQADYLDPMRIRLMTELGLTDADVIRAPSLFERISTCGGRGAALIPGMVNLVIAQVAGTTHLFTADPFFRATGAAQSTDPMITAFTQKMPAGMQLHFVDDWYVYHLGLGEVHCGSNVKRSPGSSWWTNALHLMGGN